MKRYLIATACLWASSQLLAQVADGGLDVAAEHARINGARQQVEQRFATEEAACFKTFAVNDCREASRGRRRTELADLRRQEIALNDAERKRKGALQLQRIEESTTTQDGPSTAASGPRDKPTSHVRTHAPTPPKAPYDAAKAASAQAERKALLERKERANQEEQAARDRKAAEAPGLRAQFDKKQQEAAQHKAQTAQRNAARTKPKAAPLPPPPP